MRRRSGIALGAALLLAALALPWLRPLAPPPGVWQVDLKPLGAEGLSALWLAPDGGRMLAVSDRSFVIAATLERGADGQILRVTETGRWPLRLARRAGARPGPIDSEGIAVGPGGALFVSTEGPPRLLRLDSPEAPPASVRLPPALVALEGNGALEALAIGPDGALYTLPEVQPLGSAGFPLYRRAAGEWSVLASLPAQGNMAPVGADIGPDGRLYVLYRDFMPLLGFASLLQRHELGQDALGPPETLLGTGYGQLGNVEGVSVWRAADGGLRATMITDDNGLFLQDARLIEMRLPD